jgi:hypothetical protein
MMTTHAAPKSSVRTCAGCKGKGAPDEMVRVVRGPEGQIAIDLAGGAFGRGAHVHPGCIGKACKGGFARAFKAHVKVDEGQLRTQLRESAMRRLVGLILGARRAKHLAIGAEAALQALEKGAFAVVASDAGSIVRRHEVERAVREGRAVSFGDKRVLGALVSLDEVALLAISNAAIGEQIRRCTEWMR